MGLMDAPVDTELTGPHKRLLRVLRDIGFEVEVEVEFLPNVVDCYLPEFHVAFEADGPTHSYMKDKERDDYLMSVYALPVYHVSSKVLLKVNEEELINSMFRDVMSTTWGESTSERRFFAWENSNE